MSSFGPQSLRQTGFLSPPSADTTNISRQLSTTSSSASSGYSYASDQSYATQLSSVSSGYSTQPNQNKGQSDVLARARLFESGDMNPSKRDMASSRQTLRTIPQGQATAGRFTPESSPTKSYHHSRGQSVDISQLSISPNNSYASPPSPTKGLARPASMMLGRSDSISIGAHSAQIASPDLEKLGRSTTRHLRTLSKLAQSEAADDFAITSPTQEVVGLRGRRKLQRADDSVKGTKPSGYSWEGRNWMDKQRQFLQAYEYLCHIGEAKEWIEDITQKSLPPVVELEEALRDGVTLAEVVQALNPHKHYRIFHHPKLQFRHSDNIAIFFNYLNEVELPDLFRFELIDLYEKKNTPKVIYCIHALSWILFRKGIVDFRIGNLVGQLEFEQHELEAMQKGLDKMGVNMPAFGNMGADFGEPEPEPQESEEDRIDRELGEHEESIADLQTQIRGAMLRLKLGEQMQNFWDAEQDIVRLQACIRGNFTRQIMGYRLQMRRSATLVQSTAKGFLVRRRLKQNDVGRKMAEPTILALQSAIRANKVRREVCLIRLTLGR